MYSNKQNVLELVSLMLKFEIYHIVICPGSRNAPLTQSFATDTRFKCYSVTDERSAGFFALGLTQAIKRPVAVCCTSGSALLNILPAVSEAYYQQLPLLVISADRPEEWIGQLDGQTIKQPNIGDSIFKRSIHLPEIKDDSKLWFCNRLINEALLSLTHHTNGPAHINVPLSEPLFGFTTEKLPDVRKIDTYDNLACKYNLPEQLVEQWNQANNPLVIIGQQFYSNKINQAIQRLSENKKCVVLAEKIGNITPSEGVIFNFDSILHVYPDEDKLKPDLVIYFGGHIVSKRLKAFIRNNPPHHLWLIAPNGEIVDTFQCLTTIIEANPLQVLSALETESNNVNIDYLNNWRKLSKEVEEHSKNYTSSGFSDLYTLKHILENLPPCSLQLGNSSIIRNAQLFYSEKVREVFCNRGTSGIEGSMSTAVGFSVENKDLTYLIVGDLSFFYDMNALWNSLSNRLRILVLNNGNGQIFTTLPTLEESDIRSKFIAASHNTSVKAWVEDRGCTYLSAQNQSELDNAISIFCNPKEKNNLLVLEVFTDAQLNEKDFKAYYKYLKNINQHE